MTPRENDPQSIAIGIAVWAAIDKAGTNVAQVARKADISDPTLRRICRGAGFRISTLDKVSHALKLGSVSECLTRHFQGVRPGDVGRDALAACRAVVLADGPAQQLEAATRCEAVVNAADGKDGE